MTAHSVAIRLFMLFAGLVVGYALGLVRGWLKGCAARVRETGDRKVRVSYMGREIPADEDGWHHIRLIS